MNNPFHKYFINGYRAMAFIALTSILGIAVGYLALLVFYTFNTSWAAPFTLSPSQERVLLFQPQIVALETALGKQKTDLATSIATAESLKSQISQSEALLLRVNNAIDVEAKRLSLLAGKSSAVLLEKSNDIAMSADLLKYAEKLLSQVDSDLKAGLITADQAAQRKIDLRAAINSLTDSKIQELQSEHLRQQLLQGANTLSGGSTSVSTMNIIGQQVHLKTSIIQMKVQLATAISTTDSLRKSIDETQRVLDTAKTSPFYKALTEEVNTVFVPYENMSGVEPGAAVFDCYFQIIFCRNVGVVKKVYSAEEYVRHPIFKTDLKGKLVELVLNDANASESKVLFIKRKPLLI
jgi:hypothetical protein